MKKTILPLVAILVCVICCAVVFAGCEQREINYLLVKNESTGQYVDHLDFGAFEATEINRLNTQLSALKFYFKFYPDQEIEDADMTKVKTAHLISIPVIDGESQKEIRDGLPETLQAGCSYEIWYYVEGHKPTSDSSDAQSVAISLTVQE